MKQKKVSIKNGIRYTKDCERLQQTNTASSTDWELSFFFTQNQPWCEASMAKWKLKKLFKVKNALPRYKECVVFLL